MFKLTNTSLRVATLKGRLLVRVVGVLGLSCFVLMIRVTWHRQLEQVEPPRAKLRLVANLAIDAHYRPPPQLVGGVDVTVLLVVLANRGDHFLRGIQTLKAYAVVVPVPEDSDLSDVLLHVRLPIIVHESLLPWNWLEVKWQSLLLGLLRRGGPDSR